MTPKTVSTMAVLSGPWSYLSRSSRYVSPYADRKPSLSNMRKTAPERPNNTDM